MIMVIRMNPEYTLKNGINYRGDGFAFCDRCGKVPIVNDKCLYCDVQTTDEDHALAAELKYHCFNSRQEQSPGFCDFRREGFDIEKAARIIAARKPEPEELEDEIRFW